MPKAYLLRHRFALANLHAMATLLAINTFIGVDIPVNEEGSETDMCKAWEDQKEEGRLFEVYSSVQDGDYGVKRGAEKLGISEEEFEKRMLEAGFRIPVASD